MKLTDHVTLEIGETPFDSKVWNSDGEQLKNVRAIEFVGEAGQPFNLTIRLCGVGVEFFGKPIPVTTYSMDLEDIRRLATDAGFDLVPIGNSEFTSEEVASIAAKGVVYPEKLTPDQIQAVCGSALTQARDAEP